MGETRETTLTVTGMGCASCVGHVEEALRSIEGVEHVSVDLEAGRAVVRHDARARLPKMIAAVEGAGYGAAAA